MSSGMVCDMPDCTNRVKLPLPSAHPHWTPDGQAIAYVPIDEPSNIWIQPLDGRSKRQLTTFTDREITSSAWSPGGKRLAVSRATVLSDLVLIREVR